ARGRPRRPGARRPRGTDPPPSPRWAAGGRELAPARPLRPRRGLGLRRQPPRVLGPRAPRGGGLPLGQHRGVPRRGDQQLHLEPPLDLPRRCGRGSRGVPGRALLRRLARGPARGAGDPRGARARRRRAEADRPGAGRPRRNPAELRGQQALELPPV
ncbi:MAG: hypothetical protein AVDCRST_MAG53-2430, partial [uncultured Solirubrobacteraceae bacterium]